jgi:hypothetical protein
MAFRLSREGRGGKDGRDGWHGKMGFRFWVLGGLYQVAFIEVRKASML